MFLKIHQYTQHYSPPCHTWICVTPHFLLMRSLSLGAIRKPLMVWHPLKYAWTPFSPHAYLKLSLSPCMYETTMWVFFFFSPGVVRFCWLSLLLLVSFTWTGQWLPLNFILFNAQMLYLHFVIPLPGVLALGVITVGWSTQLWLYGKDC